MYAKACIILLFTIFIFNSPPLHAQGELGSANDTLKVKGNSYIILGIRTIYIENDTVIYIPDSLSNQVYNYPTEKTKEFYDQLRERFYKNKITKEIFKLLFTEPSQKVNQQLQTAIESEAPFKPYRGKVVGKIRVKKVDVFGPTVFDTAEVDQSWFVETANKLHINTRTNALLRNLLVEKGDRIDPLALADNERIIRMLPYIRDARIVVIPRLQDRDTVDLLLLTQDVWSISFDVNPRGIDAANISVDDKNIFGLGHELNNTLVFDAEESPVFGYEGIYRIPNISGEFVVGEFNFAETYYREALGVRFYRDFISPAIKYGGGVEISKEKLRNALLLNEDTVYIFPTEVEVQDLWIGRAFPLSFGSDFLRERSRIILAGRVARHDFSIRPEVRADTNRTYHNKTIVLGSIGFSNRRYYKDRLIYGFGRTEDIPTGSLIEFTAGKEMGEFYDRTYAGLRLARGGLISNFGYAYGGISVGGFFGDSRFEQGVVKLETNFFSNLIRIKNQRIRQFVNFSYISGLRRFSDEYIDIRNDNGIRGLRSDFLRGTKKFTANIETVSFTPWYLLGFRFAVFGFADLGIIAPDNVSIFKGDFYQGFGLGVRVRNDNLTFNTFQISLAWYPTVPQDASPLYFSFSDEPALRLNDFDTKAPGLLPFGNSNINNLSNYYR